jgi:ABC-type multidrug transport system fused ATPase/permease subunit
LRSLISFLSNPEATTGEGIVNIVVFAILMLCSALFRNYYVFDGYCLAVTLRKTLVSALYVKVSKLSMRSLAETNSGKLITIVSGDI